MSLVVNLSPANTSVSETLNSLLFAHRARAIQRYQVPRDARWVLCSGVRTRAAWATT